MKRLILVLFICIVLGVFGETNQKGSLVINVSNLKNNDGQVLLKLCKTKKEFKGKSENDYTRLLEINNNQANIELDDLEYGDYALLVLHDENENKKMDTNLLKLPKEGYGTSNNKKGPPRFKKSIFSFEKDMQKIDIEMQYLGGKK